MQSPPGADAGLRARRGHERQGGPGHQVEEPGVGAVVDPRRVDTWVEEDSHQNGGQQPQGHRHDQPRAPPASAGEAEQEQQYEGPDEIELLLDRQRPRVLERRRRGELGEVRLVGVDQVPVVDVEQRGDPVTPQPGQVDEAVGTGASEMAVQDEIQAQGAHHDEERRQEASGPSTPEAGQADAPGAHPLLEQQRGDEEPRQHEEQVDPQVTAQGPPELQVIGDHAHDGEASQAVERRQVAAGHRRGGTGRRLRDRQGVEAHTRSSRLTPGRPVGRSTRSGATASSSEFSSPPWPPPWPSPPPSPLVSVRSRARSGLASLAGRGRLTAPGDRIARPCAHRLPVAPHGPAQCGGLGQRAGVGEGGAEAEDGAPAADQVQGGGVTGEEGGVAAGR